MDVEGIIERILSEGPFEAYRNGVQMAAGRHEDFQSDPVGFTNVARNCGGDAVERCGSVT